jgi:CheY-like chemotaxis protein
MIRLDGNTILVADTDKVYGTQLAEVLGVHGAKCFFAEDISFAKELLKKYDFDLVISNYHLPDGIIHHLIDWCAATATCLPIFTCTNYPMPSEIELSHKQSIAEVFSKNDFPRMLQGISRLLFDFTEFHDNLLEMMAPSEIRIEAVINNKNYFINPLELNSEGLFVQQEAGIKNGSFGILKFSLAYENQNQNFIIPGFFEGQYFKVNANYQANWEKFLKFLSLRQVNITKFMNKAAGF